MSTRRFDPIRFYAEAACLAGVLLICVVSMANPPARHRQASPKVDYIRDRGEEVETFGVCCSSCPASAIERKRSQEPGASKVSS